MGRGSGGPRAGPGRSTMSPDDPAFAGQREYSRAFLRMYDPLVLGVYCRFVWRCPAARLRANYAEHLRDDHLDVGPGTGYFLRRVRMPADQQLTLLDPNPNVLVHTRRVLAGFEPELVLADVCKPLPLQRRYASAALNLVLHCLHADGKQAAVNNVSRVLSPDGVLFGASLLASPDLHTRVSAASLRALNRRGTFDNLGDTATSLGAMLSESFHTVDIDLVGAVALFSASEPRWEEPFEGPTQPGGPSSA
jgi:SAM-dependent methyltransferase